MSAPPAPHPVQISPLQFFARFTGPETATIHAAALQSPDVLGFLLSASAATYIDLADPLTKTGLDALVATALLAACGCDPVAVLAP